MSQKGKEFLNKLKDKYRLVILNDTTFEEKLSYKLTPLNVFILAGGVSLIMIILIFSLIAFTPIREYIPGYADVNVRKNLINLMIKTDSLEQQLKFRAYYVENMHAIIQDSLPISESKQAVVDSSVDYSGVDVNPSKDDSLLREEVETMDKYSLGIAGGASGSSTIKSVSFFTPLKGIVSDTFNIAKEHYGVDVVSKKNEAIKAILDGTVLSGNWTLETGYTIVLQHSNDIVSAYKHNSALLKKAGDYVKAGEAIAIVGNTGEETSGPHLHFELWHNGQPINPEDYIVF